jgi:putative transposase
VAGVGFFRQCLAKNRGQTAAERRQWRHSIYAEIRSRVQSQGGLTIEQMCDLARVSRAGFYRHWLEKEPTAAEMSLRDAMQRAALRHRYYGYRRILVLLQREGYVVGAKKVRRLMRKDNLLAVRRRKFIVTTDSDHTFKVYPNLARHLELSDINQLWVADITYVRLEQEFVYVALVLDAYSRRVIGWAVERTMEAPLTLAALDQAIASRQPKPGLVHHSDQGSQYACGDYIDRLEACGAVLSMSRPGRPWENGRCESFIKTLKQEQLDAREYGTLEELRDHVEEFVEQIYNHERLHSALGYQSPVDFEQQQALADRQAPWMPATMSFMRHKEIYSDASTTEVQGRAEPSLATHRNECPAGYSLAGCSPAEPASASPADLVLQQEPPLVKENAANG